MSFNPIHFIKILILLYLTLFIFLACTKEGPTCPTGRDGTDGKEWSNVCGLCHDENSTLASKTKQWQNSLHSSGFSSINNTGECAVCHTSQGFRESINLGTDTTSGVVHDAMGIDCRTCHNIHKRYDSSDFMITYSDEVPLISDGEVFDFGKANICVKCHQSRAIGPIPVPDGDDITISSQQWGPLDNPVANVYIGNGNIETPGRPFLSESIHKQMTIDPCITCHMASATGHFSGGHTMKMSYEYRGKKVENLNGCVGEGCHQYDITFDRDLAQEQVKDLLGRIRGKLAEQGVLDTNSSNGDFALDMINASKEKPLTIEANLAGATYNYMLIAKDRSNGFHNTKFAISTLKNAYDIVR
jgi:hypothetical protein